jgi:hypothetical protein
VSEMKTCRCGRGFYPRDGRQKLCGPLCPTRRPRPDADGARPQTFGVRTCEGCGKTFIARAPNQVFCMSHCRERSRREQHSQLYDRQHKMGRVAWTRQVEAGFVKCRRCGVPIRPGELWDMGHFEDKRVPARPEHLKCNRGAPSRARAAERRAVGSRAVVK